MRSGPRLIGSGNGCGDARMTGLLWLPSARHPLRLGGPISEGIGLVGQCTPNPNGRCIVAAPAVQ